MFELDGEALDLVTITVERLGKAGLPLVAGLSRDKAFGLQRGSLQQFTPNSNKPVSRFYEEHTN